MLHSTGQRRLLHSRVAVLVLYAFVLAASGFFHHDLDCRQDSRTHCIACSVGQDAQKVESVGVSLDVLHRVAGRVELRASHVVDTLTACRISDRSPPTA
jgi:hypothetical protein